MSTSGQQPCEGDRMVFGEVGEALELVGVLITIFASLAIMVALGKFWES